MRELLKEAAEILGDCYYNGKEPLSDGTRAMVAKVIKRIDAAIAARDAAIRKESKWISVKEQLPESLVGVLVRYTSSYGRSHTTIAQYTASKTVLEEDFLDEDAEGCSEYDEEHDCFWVDEGWWENSWESEKNWKLTGTITHWMPLPEPPVGKEGEE